MIHVRQMKDQKLIHIERLVAENIGETKKHRPV